MVSLAGRKAEDEFAGLQSRASSGYHALAIGSGGIGPQKKPHLA